MIKIWLSVLADAGLMEVFYDIFDNLGFFEYTCFAEVV